MFLLLLGLLLIGFSVVARNLPRIVGAVRYIRLAGLGIAVLGASTACFVVIEPGAVGVQSLFGKVNNSVMYSGLHFINPLVDITTFDVRTQNYTMSSVHDEGDIAGDDAIRVLSKDGLEVIIDLSVLFRVTPEKAPSLLTSIGTGYKDVVIRPITRTRIRDNAVYYDAVSLYSSKRDEFQTRIYQSIEKDFRERGLFLEQLLVRNIVLPQSVKETIEGKINAEQEAQKMTFVLDKERQEAERKRVEAQGIADYQRIINTGLSEKQLQYEQIKAYSQLANSPNAKVIIMGNGKNPVILDAK